MGCSGSTQIGLPHKRVSSQLCDLQKKNIKDGGIEYSQFIMCNRGKITDYYEIEKHKLGEGSYGSVSKARNKETCAARAIKSIPKSKMKNFEQFKREISIMKLMDHPNIIKLYETFEDHRCLYLVMELCTGGELFDRIMDAGHFTEVQAALLMQQLIRAVHYMHKLDVCHRDLKPENFLFMNQDSIEQNVLKIIDFGLSCTFRPGQVMTSKAGTPYYVSPQVLAGKYDHMSDLWSCGVIMYVMLCGYPPFIGSTDAETLSRVRSGTFSFDQADWKNVSEDAKQLIRVLLKIDPRDRYNAEQALGHEWIRNKAPNAANVSLQVNFVDNLRSFRSQNKLKKAALHIIAGQLNETQIKALRDTFVALDSDGDGQLTVNELRLGIERAGLEEIPPDLQQIMEGVDVDGSGVIDYTEFLAATLDRRVYIQEDVCWAAFRMFDKNGDGKISQDELKQVLNRNTVNNALRESTIAEILVDCDGNGDGNIDFNEFMAMMRGAG